MVLLHW